MMVTLLALVSGAAAAPFSGCTFFKQRLANHSWPGGTDTGCAQFHVQSQACVKFKVVGYTVVTYQGDLVTGRLPEYFIEVTPHFGKSVFTEDPDGAQLSVQLDTATEYWKAQLGIAGAPDQVVAGANESDPTSPGQFLFGRAVKVPYGTLTWSQATIGVNAGAAGPAVCYESLSEYSPEVWSDKEGHAETGIAGIVNAVASDVCMLPGTAIPANLIDPPALDVVEPCAVPATREQILIGMGRPDSEVADIAINPSTMCAGRFGPLLPRTGWVADADELTAAQHVAYKTASIGKDHFNAGPGIEMDDRWQMVWPPSLNPLAGQCFIPGVERPLVEMVPLVNMPTVPLTDGPFMRPGPATEGKSPYVFAVWRRFTKCVEPGQGAIWQAELAALRSARMAACSAAPDSMP